MSGSLKFTGLLTDNGIQISMDGKGCWRDNVFVERLWKSVKCEEFYRHAYDTVNDAKRRLERYFTLCNHSFKRDCVYQACLETLEEVGRQVPGWIEHYNREAPHSALGV